MVAAGAFLRACAIECEGAGAAEMRLPMDQRRRPTPLRAQW
jgi:hypothetical protein